MSTQLKLDLMQLAELAIDAEPQREHSPEELTPEKMKQVLYELRVHQVELEMQNEELRRTQLELDVARAHYFDLYDLAPVGYCTLSERGLIVQINLTAVTMLGVVRNAAVGRGFHRYVHSEEQELLHTVLRRLAQTGERQSCELRLMQHDGASFWAQLVITVTRNEHGEVEHRIVLSDVNARKAAEDARREGEARYHELFTRASQGIALWSAEGGLVEVNPAFCRMHGWTMSELSSMTLMALDLRGATLSAERVGRMSAGAVLTFEVEHRHRAGHALRLEVSTSLIYVAGTVRVLGFYRQLNELNTLPPAVEPPAPLPRSRILVIDDEASARDVVRRALGVEHEVLAVSSALEAKTLLELDVAFDVILCAVLMPEMTGLQLFDWLERRAPALATRLVFVSGVTLAPSGALKGSGPAELRKPFQSTELRAVVARLIAARRRQAAEAAVARVSAHR